MAKICFLLNLNEALLAHCSLLVTPLTVLAHDVCTSRTCLLPCECACACACAKFHLLGSNSFIAVRSLLRCVVISGLLVAAHIGTECALDLHWIRARTALQVLVL